jgi:hypothetical protein
MIFSCSKTGSAFMPLVTGCVQKQNPETVTKLNTKLLVCICWYPQKWADKVTHRFTAGFWVLLSDCDSDHGIVACWKVLATWQLVHNDEKTAISKGEVMTVLTLLKQISKTRCCQRVSYLLVTNTCD